MSRRTSLRNPTSDPPAIEIPARQPNQPKPSKSIYLPHQSKPVAPVHQDNISFDELDDNSIPFSVETSNLLVHQRLMRSLKTGSDVAVYPWIIDTMTNTKKGREAKRNHRIREGDQRYATSASAFLSWPLDERRIRVGIFSSRSGVRNSDLGHIWALGLVGSKDVNGGVLVFIFDDAGSAGLEEARVKDTILTPLSLMRSQRSMLQKLKDKHYNIKYLYYGGKPYRGMGQMCLESTAGFVEGFVGMVNHANGFNVEMLESFGLKEIPCWSRKPV